MTEILLLNILANGFSAPSHIFQKNLPTQQLMQPSLATVLMDMVLMVTLQTILFSMEIAQLIQTSSQMMTSCKLVNVPLKASETILEDHSCGLLTMSLRRDGAIPSPGIWDGLFHQLAPSKKYRTSLS